MTSIASEYILTQLSSTKSKIEFENISIAFILYLLSASQNNIPLLIFADILAHTSLRFLRYKQNSIFNPFAFGLFFANILGLNISWWGIQTNIKIILVMLVLGFIKNYFDKSIRIIFLYLLLIVFISFILSFNALYSIKLILIPGLLFFSFYILTKNMVQTIYIQKLSIIYVVTTAFLSIVLPKFGIFTEPLMTSVLISDIGLFVSRFLKIKKTFRSSEV